MPKSKKLNLLLAPVLALLFCLSGVSLSGCFGNSGDASTLQKAPSITTPAIRTAGVLNIGVNSTDAPYAGSGGGKLIGIDCDVAAAVATQLGLHLTLTDVSTGNASQLLSTGQVDALMSAQPTNSPLSQATAVGPYVQTATGLFACDPTGAFAAVTVSDIAKTAKVACQSGSQAAQLAAADFASANIVQTNSLTEAFTDLHNNSVNYVLADAVVGSYAARSYDDIACLQLLDQPTQIDFAVSNSDAPLIQPLSQALQSVISGGEMQVILSKWLGQHSAAVVAPQSAVTSSAILGTAAGANAKSSSASQQKATATTTANHTASSASSTSKTGAVSTQGSTSTTNSTTKSRGVNTATTSTRGTVRRHSAFIPTS
ncbi:MAG: transporter substrate-binding domain-containing protein [Coriobacteriales bacterium]|nr:transporter substrate-binding domain-containing protein [Coriobacteriales bacterium]